MDRCRSFLNKHSRKIEEWIPFFFAIVIAVIIFFIPKFFHCNLIPSQSKFENILEITINITAILIGFVATMLAVLSSLSSAYVIEILRKTKTSHLIYHYFKKSLYWGSSFLIISLGLILYLESLKEYIGLIFLFWIFLLLISVLSSFRIIYFMLRIIEKEDSVRSSPHKETEPIKPSIRHKPLDQDKQWDPDNDE